MMRLLGQYTSKKGIESNFSSNREVVDPVDGISTHAPVKPSTTHSWWVDTCCNMNQPSKSDRLVTCIVT